MRRAIRAELAATAAAETAEQLKRQRQGRSPAYPGIALKEAIAKAKALYDAEGKYAVPMPSAFAAWGYGAKSSGGRETRAALKYFGLITIEGDGETGKVKLTDSALRVLLDEREDQTEKKLIIRRLALTPPIHKKLLERFADGIKSDATVRHFLTFEEQYNEGAAADLVAEFKATADYAELYKPVTIPVKEDERVAKHGAVGDPSIKIGDYVQWTSNGQDQFSSARRVDWISEDGAFLRVFGDMTGIPMAEVTIAEAPKPIPANAIRSASIPLPASSKAPDINILMSGQRLQITADVDLAGVAKLKEALGKYEELLKLLQ